MIVKRADGTLVDTSDGLTAAAAERARKVRRAKELLEAGHSITEIAERLGVSRGTAWNYVHRDRYEAAIARAAERRQEENA